MKRRNFLRAAVIGSAAAVVAPTVFAQNPHKWYNDWIEDFHSWETVPRGVEHVSDNNYWDNLQGRSEWGYGDINKQWMAHRDKYFEASDDGRVIMFWDEGGIIHMRYDVILSDYDNVYQHNTPGSWMTSTKHCPMDLWWMNVEDYIFYRQLMDMGEYSFYKNSLMGCGLVSQWLNPFTDNKSQWIRDCAEGNCGYEIHVMWRKR